MNEVVRENQRVSLDWSRLLGFDQVRRHAEGTKLAAMDFLLAKVGKGKIGSKRSSNPE
jgi:hypothetical protein